MISCDNNDFGCNGGYLSNAWTYLAQTGAVIDQCFPYVSGTSTTPSCPKPFVKCPSKGAPVLKYKCANIASYITGVDAIK